MAKHEYDRPVTEFDFRAKEFQHPDIKPEDYEFRSDGVLVRKDRWERAIHQLARTREFEIDDVVDMCKEWEKGDEAFRALHEAFKVQVEADEKTYTTTENRPAMGLREQVKVEANKLALKLIEETAEAYGVKL